MKTIVSNINSPRSVPSALAGMTTLALSIVIGAMYNDPLGSISTGLGSICGGGKYDFTLSFSRERTTAPTDTGTSEHEPLSDIFAAVQTLGLKLELKRGPTEVIVIDHVEKVPAAN